MGRMKGAEGAGQLRDLWDLGRCWLRGGIQGRVETPRLRIFALRIKRKSELCGETWISEQRTLKPRDTRKRLEKLSVVPRPFKAVIFHCASCPLFPPLNL